MFLDSFAMCDKVYFSALRIKHRGIRHETLQKSVLSFCLPLNAFSWSVLYSWSMMISVFLFPCSFCQVREKGFAIQYLLQFEFMNKQRWRRQRRQRRRFSFWIPLLFTSLNVIHYIHFFFFPLCYRSVTCSSFSRHLYVYVCALCTYVISIFYKMTSCKQSVITSRYLF